MDLPGYGSPLFVALSTIIFNAVVDALEWVAHNRRMQVVSYYLDDFMVLGLTTSE